MEMEFYHCEPAGGRVGRLLRPVRRALRLAQRPYFHRLRDLLTFLFHKHLEAQQRMDDITAHIRMVEAAYGQRLDDLAHRLDAAHRQMHELARAIQSGQQAGHQAAGPLLPQAITADFLALTRRLTALEDMLVDLSAEWPAAAADAPGEPADGVIPMYAGPRRLAS